MALGLPPLWIGRALGRGARQPARPEAPVPQPRQIRWPLREIGIELTSKCNLSCEMCSVWKGRRDGIDKGRIFDLLAEARALGARTFTPCGAEIFMRKDTPEILREADRLGFETQEVVTNGMLIERHAEALSDLASLRLHISIDGPEDVHDALRGAGAYRAALAGVRAAMLRGIPVSLKGVLMRPTLGSAGHLVDLACELGLTTVSYQPFQPEIAGPDRDHSPWVFDGADRDEVERALDGLMDRAQRVGITVSTESLFPEIVPYLFDGRRPVPPGGCRMPARFLLIDGRGETYPCFFMRGRSMGNVTKGVRLRDIWHGPVQTAMQERGLTGNCPGCLASCSDVASFDAAAQR